MSDVNPEEDISSPDKSEKTLLETEEKSGGPSKKAKIIGWSIPIVIILIVASFVLAQDNDSPYVRQDSVPSNKQPAKAEKIETKKSSEPEIQEYSGCDGLEDLIPKIKSAGGASMAWHQVVQIGDRGACDNLIESLNKPELYKDWFGKIGTGIVTLLTVEGLGIWTIIDVVRMAIQKFTDEDGAVIKA